MASITEEDVNEVANAFGFAVPAADVGDYKELLEKTRATLEIISSTEG
jgi:hypothetical protein